MVSRCAHECRTNQAVCFALSIMIYQIKTATKTDNPNGATRAETKGPNNPNNISPQVLATGNTANRKLHMIIVSAYAARTSQSLTEVAMLLNGARTAARLTLRPTQHNNDAQSNLAVISATNNTETFPTWDTCCARFPKTAGDLDTSRDSHWDPKMGSTVCPCRQQLKLLAL